MKKIFWLGLAFFALLQTLPLMAQDEFTDLIREGIALHDAGKYQEALEKYEKALQIDKKGSMAYYEMGYTYQEMKQYDLAIKAYDKVIKIGEQTETLLTTYMNKASILDDIGKPKDALKLYKKAIDIYPNHYLLHYNFGVTNFRVQNFEEAETAFTNAILLNTNHASSHRALGNLQQYLNKRPQALLAQYFFLLLEPKTDRGAESYVQLTNLLQKGVEKVEGEATNKININLSPALIEDKDTAFVLAEMMLSTSAALRYIKGNKDQSDEQLFIDQTNTFFSTLSETQEKNKDRNKGIYWELYVNFFAKLQKAGHVEAFCYHISQSKGEVVDKLMKENGEKIDAFYKWLQEQ